MKCRNCDAPLNQPMIDLGSAPASNAYLTEEALRAPERNYPLRVFVCESCWLVQTEDFVERDELFNGDYAYYSSTSSSWVAHARRYFDEMVQRFHLGPASLVVEVAANDGYLLQHAKQAGIPCLGIEPTAGTASAARAKGIDIIEEFFGVRLARKLRDRGRGADLMIANNVLAHVPDLHDFAAGFAQLLEPDGVATFEFPHLMNLVRECQFDTIYHEHYSYLSLGTISRVFASCGLAVFDVDEIPTHGGSLRVYAQRTGARHAMSPSVARLIGREEAAGLFEVETYRGLQARAERIRDDFLTFLISAKRDGKRVAAYGAAAKGNTLINFAGVRPDLIAYVADRSPGKRGRYLPGSRIPIVDELRIFEERPAYVVLLPWNLKAELVEQLAAIRDWGGRFVTAVPTLEITA